MHSPLPQAVSRPRADRLRVPVRLLLSLACTLALPSGAAVAQAAKQAPPPVAPQPAVATSPTTYGVGAAPQPNDEEYTRRIREYLRDPRITTELVDHLPASSTVPTPLKFLGTMPGQPGELYYAKDIERYFRELARVSPRARFSVLGTTEEGRDQVLLALADSATLANLDGYRSQLAALTDPRKTTEAQAREIIERTGKPIYWITSGIHSPETGGPQMLTELAYRLVVEETPLIQAIRANLIVFITPVVEVDGREKEVDTWYYGKKTGKQRPPLMYWGRYVQHDNNRDGMGQVLKLTQNITKGLLEWHPTIVHDLHEAQSYLYVSTGTGPYNDALDPIAVNEWWLLAETEVMEMAKRGVPGVFTYGFYDGWTPNYLFWIAITHNSFGRFYEVQSYGPDNNDNLRLGATATSREWFRTNPPLPSIKWGPRNNVNIQESALLLALDRVAQDRSLYLENYWLKNRRAVEKGKAGPPYAWVIPAAQRRRVEAADMVNDLRRQGVEVQQATSPLKLAGGDVAPGDFVIRADQPFRTLVDMYFSVQNYAPGNPLPYDDTGWTMPFMRDVEVKAVTDRAVLDQPMTLLAADAHPAGVINGSGPMLVVDNTSDNALVTFRFRNASVKLEAAEQDFDAAGHHFRAGAFIVPAGDRARVEPSIRELGLTAWALDAAPSVKSHTLDLPRIGYVHSWTRTQDEGWVRVALDHYGVPYTYFADNRLREGNLRAKYDVIIFPHVGGSATSQVNGLPKTTPDPVPYRRTALTPNLGTPDASDDIRGGMGIEGLMELAKFVRAGGTLVTEGSTATILPAYGLLSGVTVEEPQGLFVRGSIVRGVFSDRKSPIAYGYGEGDLPVYFSQAPVLSAGGGLGGFGGFGGRGGAAIPGVGQNVTPNAGVTQRLSPWNPPDSTAARAPARSQEDELADARATLRQFGFVAEDTRPRVVLRFPQNPADMLLSGTLVGGQALAGRALAVDVPMGQGHVVMFALRPFWRWQTQGTMMLAFNAIMNWDHLSAGAEAPPKAAPAR